MKYTLTQVKKYTKDANGKPYIAQSGPNKGKPYTRMNIQVQEYGDRWISLFGNSRNDGWRAGDQVELEITEKTVGDKTYLNAEMPKPAGQGGMSEQDKQTLTDIKVAVNMAREDIKRILAILSTPEEEPPMPDFGEEK